MTSKARGSSAPTTSRSGFSVSSIAWPSRRNSGLEAPIRSRSGRSMRATWSMRPLVPGGTVDFTTSTTPSDAARAISRTAPSTAMRLRSPSPTGGRPTQTKTTLAPVTASGIDPVKRSPPDRTPSRSRSSRPGSWKGALPACSVSTFVGVGVHADDLVAEARERGSRDQPDVADAHDRDLHRATSSIGAEPAPALNQSVVRATPSSMLTCGTYPSILPASDTSAWVMRTSPARDSVCTGSGVDAHPVGDQRQEPVHRRRLPAAADVERHAVGLGRRLRRAQVRLDDVVDVGEVARLLAVAVHLGAGAGEAGHREPRHDRRVLGLGVLPRPVDVEVAQRHRRHAVAAIHAGAVDLERELAGRVRRARRERHRLPQRELGLVPVDRAAARGHDHGAGVARGEQHVQGSAHVHVGREPRLLHRPRHRALGALVVDRGAAACRVGHGRLVAQVRLDEPHLGRLAQVVEGAVGEIVEADDLGPVGHEPTAQMGTDESSGSCHEHTVGHGE